MMRQKSAICFLYLFLSVLCYGQTGKLFTVDNELSSSMINSIYQDKEDIIWIYNPQIEMFARFKMKSSFHKTKRII